MPYGNCQHAGQPTLGKRPVLLDLADKPPPQAHTRVALVLDKFVFYYVCLTGRIGNFVLSYFSLKLLLIPSMQSPYRRDSCGQCFCWLERRFPVMFRCPVLLQMLSGSAGCLS